MRIILFGLLLFNISVSSTLKDDYEQLLTQHDKCFENIIEHMSDTTKYPLYGMAILHVPSCQEVYHFNVVFGQSFFPMDELFDLFDSRDSTSTHKKKQRISSFHRTLKESVRINTPLDCLLDSAKAEICFDKFSRNNSNKIGVSDNGFYKEYLDTNFILPLKTSVFAFNRAFDVPTLSKFIINWGKQLGQLVKPQRPQYIDFAYNTCITWNYSELKESDSKTCDTKKGKT